MPTRAKHGIAIFFTGLTVVISGCETSQSRIPIQGKVTYKGKPLAEGTIMFLPKDATKATMEGSLIRDGNYAIAADKGLFAGAYNVSITAPDGKGARPPAGSGPGAPRRSQELLPEQYNRKTTLSIEVTPAGKREFNFDLE